MATAKSNVNVKIDSTVKEQATQLLNRMGIDQTTAIDMFYRQIITEKGLPFQPRVAPASENRLLTAIEKKDIAKVTLEVDEEQNCNKNEI